MNWFRRPVVLCHGCFDILHIGHFDHFRAARAYGERLVVSVTAAKWVRLAKGEGHPAHTDAERVDMLRELRIVDEVYLCDSPTAVRAIIKFKPRFFAKGSDYAARGINPLELEACGLVGAQVIYTATRKRSVLGMVSEFQQLKGGAK